MTGLATYTDATVTLQPSRLDLDICWVLGNISMHASIDSFISPSTSPMGKHKLGSAAFENLKPLEEARHNNNA
ncbi:Uncharacterized protein HZ326_20676 [Fusarium oxysporum f. sp. albedinis]|nr:Uncharacterized protein HZ326_20676 [Fusarium oxysporum f. sp. albedinis]